MIQPPPRSLRLLPLALLATVPQALAHEDFARSTLAWPDPVDFDGAQLGFLEGEPSVPDLAVLEGATLRVLEAPAEKYFIGDVVTGVDAFAFQSRPGLADRLIDTSFFLPSGLVTADGPLEVAGGGSPLLWQHLFWFLAHPEVYVLILPAMGIVAEVIANNTRKPLWGYKLMVYSVIFLGFMSFIVWAHHMFITGMGTAISAFFQVTTMIISIPSVIILSALFISLWGGSIRFTVPMLFALGFLPMFGIGGLTGLPLGLAPTDIPLHDTYYVIGHFHYVVAPGTILALFAGVYYWYPKVTGREMNEMLGKIHFWGSLIFMNGIFFPMLIQGMAGVSRRLFDGGLTYSFSEPVLHYNSFMSVSAFLLLLAQIPFIINFFMSLKKGKKVEKDNHWEATTLEWSAAPTPPVGHGNFVTIPSVYRNPYEYSPPGNGREFIPQNEPPSPETETETVDADA